MSKGECGNILEADEEVRSSLDRVMLLIMKVLENLGVEILTAFEASKRVSDNDSIIIESGSTCLAMVKYLNEKKG